MKTETLAHNPFMMLLSPDVVVAAMERSEKLGRLNRRLCQPLDRMMPPANAAAPAVGDVDDESDRP